MKRAMDSSLSFIYYYP